ncbi:hypothetical protein HETIRDRAFT_457652 [Heterobasidion irregulare TC 32-1]|uniref:Uncharacterized protein n=1 Tax=Heterobasidion irregulare (strain TC 32-1) TaxID=747525 RepID=W4KJX9_HETIT|nr:uncharacterized protein HETIRDRAFT_457652 [Heterobasidion irregulare TC 32-1]ETW86157.1 hypothetical protein HETIRDRAFT_457652 [Heterobasidion irregulare TC 32-1]
MSRGRPQSALYYQIGGYLADSTHWFGYDTPKLVDAFWQLEPGGIDLTLGIVPSGASYLLLPLDRWPALQRAYGLRTPHKSRPASAYLSLSPIHFDTPAAFKKKLDSLRPKKTKQPTDTSQANKRYAIGPKDGGAPRAAFEHSRLLLRALRADFDVAPYGLARGTQWADLQVLALAFNRWSMGTQLLDLGWTRARLGAAQLDTQSAVHIALAEGAHFGVEKRRKAAFKHGEAETMGAHAAAARLRDTLAEMRAAPVLLLVHDEPAARAALHDLGIETSTWASGADALLRAGLVKHEADRRPPYRDERSYDRPSHDSRAPYRNEDRGNGRRDGYGYDYDRGRDRSYAPPSRNDRAPARRSLSPHRDRDRDRARDRRDDHARERDHSRSDRARGPSSRSRSSERDGPADAGGGVYVVDVHVLFDALTQKARTRRTIGADARDAGVREAGEGEWCAGNESRVLAELWYTMAAGEAIDEQRAARWPDGLGSGGPAAAGGAGGAGGRSGDATDDVDPNDVDPNDIEPARNAALTIYDDFDLHDSEEERGDAQYLY